MLAFQKSHFNSFSSCKSLTLHLLVNSSPFIANDNLKLTLAPFNTQYSCLEEQIHSLNIRTELLFNSWNNPFPKSCMFFFSCFSIFFFFKAAWFYSFFLAAVELMNPQTFCPFTVPFSGLGGSTVKNPCELPLEFVQVLQHRTNQINLLRSMFNQLQPNVQNQLFHIIQAKFQVKKI